MRRVILSNLISLDGFMAGPNGEIDWFTGIADREFEAYAVDLIRTVDTMLFGRVTYELMAGYWPTASPETEDPRIIDAMNNTGKVVFSRTLDGVDWKNSRLLRGDAAEETAKLKQQTGRDMVVYGSGGIVSALAPKGLIDDYRIFVAPIVLGKGKPLFGAVETRLRLRLRETKTFGSGMVLLRYEPV
jgi:dihydrofolate reductase